MRTPDWLYAWALEEFQRNSAWGPFRPKFVLLVFLVIGLLWLVIVTLLRLLGLVSPPS